MSWKRRLAALGLGVTFAVAMAATAGGTAALAAPSTPAARAAHQAAAASSHAKNHPTFMIRRIGTRANGSPQVTSASPTGLPPSAIQHVYNLSGLSPTSNAGSGQIIAIVDAFADPNALADLNVFNAQYGYPAAASPAARPATTATLRTRARSTPRRPVTADTA